MLLLFLFFIVCRCCCPLLPPFSRYSWYKHFHLWFLDDRPTVHFLRSNILGLTRTTHRLSVHVNIIYTYIAIISNINSIIWIISKLILFICCYNDDDGRFGTYNKWTAQRLNTLHMYSTYRQVAVESRVASDKRLFYTPQQQFKTL